MTPPLLFLFCCKIKTPVNNNYVHFVFMYLRPSSRGLQDTPQVVEEQNTIIKDFTEAALFYTKNII
ncbi:hypothetical protein FGG79_12115 [Bacillus sp. BHET2]|nr:hypothetical protein FGG79_12115 [Bacillus sp. BHET2]